MGLCADRYNPWMLSSAMMTASSLSVFLFWGVLSKNLGGLVAFGLGIFDRDFDLWCMC
jgi:hypothetical protein